MMHLLSLALLNFVVSVLGTPCRHCDRFHFRAAASSDPAWKRQSTSYPPNTIDMPIDHFPNNNRYLPHTNATFKQYYYFDSSHYKPGGPVFLYMGGETDARNRFSNLQTGIIPILMSQFNGLGVILENRYYGQS